MKSPQQARDKISPEKFDSLFHDAYETLIQEILFQANDYSNPYDNLYD